MTKYLHTYFITILYILIGSMQVAQATPQSLYSVYQQAVANDPTLAAAKKANEAVQENIVQAAALNRPQVDVSAGLRASRNDIRFIGNAPFPSEGLNTFEGYQYGVTARQPIYRKQNKIVLDQSKLQVSQANKQWQQTQQQLMFSTTQAYANVLMAKASVTQLAAQQTAIEQQLAQAKANFDVGNATITDVNEAQARNDLVAAQAIAAQNQYQVALHGVEVLTGTRPEKLIGLREGFSMPSLEGDMPSWVARGLQHSLSIQSQQEALAIAKKEIERSKAGLYPTLDGVVTAARTYENGGNFGFGQDLKSLVLGVQLAVPLYHGGEIRSKTRQALLNQEKVAEDLAAAKRQITLATQQAYLTVESNIAQINALKAALVSSQSQLDATQTGYDVGIRTSVDVLNAQQQYYAAERDLAVAHYQYLVSWVRLKTIVGEITEADLQTIDTQWLAQH